MESMGSHLQDNHQEEFLENSFSTLLSWSAVQKMGIKSCPLCSSCGAEDSPELVNHVLQHTYEFALRSLPWPQHIMHNLNVLPGGFDLLVNSNHAEELQVGSTEDILIDDPEDGQRLTARNLQRLKAGGIRHWTAEGIQLWINKEVHERKEPPELQLTDHGRADHSAPDNPELFEYSNYFLTNQYFGDGSDEDKSSKPQRGRSSGNSITISTGTDRSVWNEAESLETQVMTAAANEVDGEEKLQVLLKGLEGHITVTKDIVKAAASNDICGKQVMGLLLIQPVDNVAIEAEAVASIAENFDGEMMELLLKNRGDHITVTVDIVEAAAKNLESYYQVMELLREHGAKSNSPAFPISLCSLKLDAVGPHLKKSGDDWHVIFNPQVQRALDVDAVHTLFHDDIVCSVQFSPDGRYVATGSNRLARIFDVRTGEEICTLKCETASISEIPLRRFVKSVSFSPSGKYLAAASEDEIVRVWDIATETLHKRFVGHKGVVCICHFTHDERTVISGDDRTVRLWDINTGVNTLTLTVTDTIKAVALSPDSQYIATGGYDKIIYLREVMSCRSVEDLNDLDGHTHAIHSIDFLPNGKGLVSGSSDFTIKMWELRSPRGEPDPGKEGSKCVRTLQGHSDCVVSVAVSPDSLWIISGARDHSAQFWDSRTGEAQFIVRGHRSSIFSVASNPQGGYFATAGGDLVARIWAYYPFGAND